MANSIERMTVVFPEPMAKEIRNAVETGEYASTSEVVREAVRDWTRKRWLENPDLTSRLKEAVADSLARGGGKPFDSKTLLADIHARKAKG